MPGPQLDAVIKWLKSLPSAKRPLVKSSVQLASDEAVEKLQLTMAPLPARGAAGQVGEGWGRHWRWGRVWGHLVCVYVWEEGGRCS